MSTFGHGYDVVCFYRKSNHKGLIPLIGSRPFFSPSKNFYRTAIIWKLLRVYLLFLPNGVGGGAQDVNDYLCIVSAMNSSYRPTIEIGH